MKPLDLRSMSVPELVRHFATLGIEQYKAEMGGEQKRLNRLLLQMRDITLELKNRPGDQRSALIPLYSHTNIQVRVMAAKVTLAVAPLAAKATLQKIADSKDYPQAMDAGMSLWALEKGISKPT